MDLFLQLLANGLVIGTFYALSALGLTLVFGLMRIVNFAHGELYVVGGLLGWSLTDQLGLNFFLALVIVVFVLAVIGYLIDRFMMSRVRGQGEEPTILLTIGLSIFITNTALLIVGTAPLKVASPFENKPLFLGPVVITQSRLMLVVICAAIIIGAHLLIQKTSIGRAMRATFQDAMAAQLAGIRTAHIYGFTFALGAALAGVAGIMYGTDLGFINIDIGFQNGIFAFTAAVLGGIGNLKGAVVGGIVIGLVKALGGQYLPGGTAYDYVWIFVVLIAVLVFRPQGFFGESERVRA
jgi:branched-chain amino acid transport system permease protein